MLPDPFHVFSIFLFSFQISTTPCILPLKQGCVEGSQKSGGEEVLSHR